MAARKQKTATPAPAPAKTVERRTVKSAPARVQAPPAKAPTTPSPHPNTHSAKRARLIKILSRGNPRRPGSEAYKYFAAMEESDTIGDYISKFPDGSKEQRDAILWMYQSVRKGHARLVS